MATDRKESVIISVSAEGVSEAVKQIKDLTSSLKDSGLSSGKGITFVSQADASAMKEVQKSLKDMSESLASINRRQSAQGLMGLVGGVKGLAVVVSSANGLLSVMADGAYKASLNVQLLGTKMKALSSDLKTWKEVGPLFEKLKAAGGVGNEGLLKDADELGKRLDAAFKNSPYLAKFIEIFGDKGAKAVESMGKALQGASAVLPAAKDQMTKGLTALGAVGGNLALTGSLKALTPVIKGASKEIVSLTQTGVKQLGTLAKSFAATHKSALLLAGAAAALTGAIAGVVLYVKANHESLKVYEQLNPEAETYTRTIAATKNELDALKMASESVFGETWNKQVLPIVKEFSAEVIKVKGNLLRLWTTLWEGGDTLKLLGLEFKKQFSVIMGTILQSLESILPKRLAKALNLDYGVKQAILSAQSASAEFDKNFNLSKTGKRYQKELEKARAFLSDKAKEAGKDVTDTAKTTVDELKTIYQGFYADVDNFFNDFTLIADPVSGKDSWWSVKLFNNFDKVKQQYQEQLEELSKMEGDPTVLAATRRQLEQNYQNKIKDLQLQNAREVGNQRFLVEQMYQDQELQRFKRLQAEKQAAEEERLAAIKKREDELAEGQKQLFDFMQSNLTGPLASGVLDLIDAGLEGTKDMRQAAFDMFQSLAKNMFRSSMTTLIESGIKAAAGQLEGNAKYGLPGIAMAAAASGIIAGTIAVYKSKIKQAKVEYATGGYVSAGMVRGAYSSKDSVEALLQPGERVLSKEETKAYDKGLNTGNINNITINFNGQMTSQSQLDTWTRQSLLPSLNRALGQGYKLAT